MKACFARISPVPKLALALVLAASLTVASGTRAEVPNVGGEVPSTIELSVSETTPFTRVSRGPHGSVYSALIGVEATATEAPVRLSIADGETAAGRRRGRMVRGSSFLKAPLEARVDRGSYGSLDASVDPLLRTWSEPISAAIATIQLRQSAKASISTLRGYRKSLLVTVTVAGP
jgi:hypothetical protein